MLGSLGRGGCEHPMGTQGSLRATPVYPQVCYGGRCQNLLVYGNKNCSAKCNNHGVGCEASQSADPGSCSTFTALTLPSLIPGVQPQAGMSL